LAKRDAHLLIDGDIILHRFSSSNETSVDWGDGPTTGVASVGEAVCDVDSFLHTLLYTLKAVDMSVIFSGSRNFRYSVLSSYKWNRKKTVKPQLFGAIKEHLQEHYLCMEQDKLEGDDLMGIVSTANKGKYIICSIDKDMLQIPGKHYNWNTNKKKTVTKAAGDRWFYTQVLTGDPGDGYTGIPGIGKVKANAILECAEAAGQPFWDAVVEAYVHCGLSEVHALDQARVARILRDGEYNFETGEVKLWTPSHD
jgi:DNA polymerase-1